MENIDKATAQAFTEPIPENDNNIPEDPNDPSPITMNLKKELQCPICDQIPSSLPMLSLRPHPLQRVQVDDGGWNPGSPLPVQNGSM